jgi:hypothetical protein
MRQTRRRGPFAGPERAIADVSRPPLSPGITRRLGRNLTAEHESGIEPGLRLSSTISQPTSTPFGPLDHNPQNRLLYAMDRRNSFESPAYRSLVAIQKRDIPRRRHSHPPLYDTTETATQLHALSVSAPGVRSVEGVTTGSTEFHNHPTRNTSWAEPRRSAILYNPTNYAEGEYKDLPLLLLY